MPTLYSVAYLEDDKWHGWVKVTTNVLDIEGTGTGIYSFVDNNYIDLTASGSSVTFAENFNLSGDFIVEAKGYDVSANKSVLTMAGSKFNYF